VYDNRISNRFFQIDQHVYSILEVPTNFDWPRIHAEFQITTKNRPLSFDNNAASLKFPIVPPAMAKTTFPCL
jgi:hypothetical protein